MVKPHTFLNYFEDAEATDKWPIFSVGPDGGVLTRLTFRLNGSSTPTLDFNLEKRDEDDPGSAGSDILAADEEIDTTSQTISDFSSHSPNISARQSVWMLASAKTGTVDWVMIQGEWEDPPITITVPDPGTMHGYEGGLAGVVIANVTISVSISEPGRGHYNQAGDLVGADVVLDPALRVRRGLRRPLYGGRTVRRSEDRDQPRPGPVG